jgi:hypothetical protein
MKDELPQSNVTNQSVQSLFELLPLVGPAITATSFGYTVGKDVSNSLATSQTLLLQILRSSYDSQSKSHELLLRLVSGCLHGIIVEKITFDFPWGEIQPKEILMHEQQEYKSQNMKQSYSKISIGCIELEHVPLGELSHHCPISIPPGSSITFAALLSHIDNDNISPKKGWKLVIEYSVLNEVKSTKKLVSPFRLVW